MTFRPHVLAVILNYRTPQLTLACLRALQRELLPGGSAILVDNGGADEAWLRAETHRQGWDGWLTVEATSHNLGFAGGVAHALRKAPAFDYLWFLNSDTQVEKGALDALLAEVAHPKTAIVGSSLLGEDGRRWQSAFDFPSLWNELERGAHTQWFTDKRGKLTSAQVTGWREARDVDWVPAASALVPATAWQALGGFDQKFFLYYEDVDWCRRAAAAGWRRRYVPQSLVRHLRGASSSRSLPLPRYWFEARRRYFVKHHGRCYAALADLAWLSGRGLAWLRRRTREELKCEPPRAGRDHLRYLLANFWRGVG